MQRLKLPRLLALVSGLFATAIASATLVQQMNLGELTVNADKIFRGTVIRVDAGTVTAGGGELATVKYVIRVTETLKGDTASKDGKAGNVVEVTMVGSIKGAVTSGDVQRFNAFQPPKLETGNEYLLFVTAPSSIGLAMTVGVGQGAFSFVEGEFVMNEAKNAGLFRDMDSQGMPERGAIPYSALVQRINSLLGN